MNDKDLNNLNFILEADEAAFDQWLDAASDDDIEYALELIHQAKKDYMMKELELMDSLEFDTSEADIVINQIKNKR
jgi:uncharacterized protein YihD (DUF1040 family)